MTEDKTYTFTHAQFGMVLVAINMAMMDRDTWQQSLDKNKVDGFLEFILTLLDIGDYTDTESIKDDSHRSLFMSAASLCALRGLEVGAVPDDIKEEIAEAIGVKL